MLWLNIGKVNKFWKKMLDCEWKRGKCLFDGIIKLECSVYCVSENVFIVLWFYSL